MNKVYGNNMFANVVASASARRQHPPRNNADTELFQLRHPTHQPRMMIAMKSNLEPEYKELHVPTWWNAFLQTPSQPCIVQVSRSVLYLCYHDMPSAQLHWCRLLPPASLPRWDEEMSARMATMTKTLGNRSLKHSLAAWLMLNNLQQAFNKPWLKFNKVLIHVTLNEPWLTLNKTSIGFE